MKTLVQVAMAVSAAFLLTAGIYNSEQIRDNYINTAQAYVVALTNADGTHGGTGFYVQAASGNVFILTNNHVCGLADNGRVLVDGQFVANVVANYPRHDLCLLSNPTGHRGLSVGTTVYNGLNVYVIGHPHLEPTSTSKGQIAGRMSITIAIGANIPCEGPGLTRLDFPPDSLAAALGINSICLRSFDTNPVTANILPGNSGSPVVDRFKRVVGVAFAGQDGSGRGYVVPLEYVQDFLGGF